MQLYDQRPWLKNYPAGIPANINPDEYATLLDMFDDTFKKYGKLKAFHCMGANLTYEKLDSYSRNFAGYLHSRGLEPGDHIALMMPNLLQYPIALFGCLRAGLVLVNTNPLYTPREMAFQFSNSEVKAIIIAENFAANLEEILDKTKIKTIIITSIGEMLGTVKGGIVNFVVRKIKRMVPKYNLPNIVNFTHAIKEGSNFTPKPFDGKPEDVIMLQYTGGTTGVSKGAMLTNRNLVANMLQIRSVMMPFLEEEKEIVLCPLPMYHIFAFTVNCLALLSIGSYQILVTNARDLPSVIKEFKKNKISLFTGVNTLFNSLLHHKDFSKCDFSSLKITVAGGMALQRAVAEKWKAVTGCNLAEGYGLTETSPVACVNPLDGNQRAGTIGLPAPSTDMQVVDDMGNIVIPGEIGEIQIKGPQVMKGYYKNIDETMLVMKDNWFSTGDLGRMQEGGFFEIVDRKKEMILVSGFNVYPKEIEEVVCLHPKVLEAAAIGVPDDKSGEIVKLYVVKKEKSLDEDELIAYCKENLTNYKVPKIVEFRTSLPKSNVGKILKRELKAEMNKN